MEYPEQPIGEESREEIMMVAAAESNAPPAMLAAQRQWDRQAEQR